MKKVLFVGLTLVIGLLSTSCQGSGKGAPENGSGTEKVLKDTVKSDSVLSEMALAIERQVVLERVKCIYGLIKQETTYLGGSVDNDWLDKAFCSKRWNDLLMAVRRLKEANYDSNYVLKINYQVGDFMGQLAQICGAQLEAVGIKVELNAIEVANYVNYFGECASGTRQRLPIQLISPC